MRVDPGSPLHDAVRAVVGRPDFTIEDARREPLEYDAFLAHRTVSRITGTATADGDRIPWAMIEKSTEGPSVASPYLVDNAVREFAAYTSGLLDQVAPAVRAPRLLAAHADASGRLTVWLEEIPTGTPRPLDADTLLAVSRDLGALAGRWAGRVPDHPWLFTGWIDRHSQPEAVDDGLDTLGREHPAVVDRLGDRLSRATRLVHEQARVRDILEALPQTLCHHDAVGANVFHAGGATILIDWESVGPGPVGADLASLLFSSARRGDCSAALATSIVDSAIDAYVAGMHAQAPSIAASTVRRGFDASVALRWKLVRDVVDAVERRSSIRRGSAPAESPGDALAEFEILVDLLLDCAGRVLDDDHDQHGEPRRSLIG